jgi:hypothetical protein
MPPVCAFFSHQLHSPDSMEVHSSTKQSGLVEYAEQRWVQSLSLTDGVYLAFTFKFKYLVDFFPASHSS